MNLPVNATLRGGTYQIKRFISSGGFGCTYEAVHVMLGKRIAIKEFFVKDFCNRDDTTSHVCIGTDSKKPLADKLKKKFIDEARSVCSLSHPGIVSVSDVFEENDTAYYVMDYIDGDTLSSIIKREGNLPESKAVRYIRQVMDALEYVHNHNRLHLDIKPGNIMIDRTSDRAILIDFGTSKQYDEESGESTSTLTGKTPGYAPLEQMGNAVSRFCPATDIYAVGATLYKMITGITPPGSNMIAAGEDLAPLPEIISDPVREAVAAAMRLKKDDRPQTIAALRDILDGNPGGDESTVIDETASTKTHGAKTASKANDKTSSPRHSSAPEAKHRSGDNIQGKQTGAQPQGQQKSRKNLLIGVGVAVAAIITVAAILFSSGSKDSTASEKVAKFSQEYVIDRPVTNAGGKSFMFTGQLAEGELPNGRGIGKYEQGTYTGRYVEGVRQGEGEFITADGSNKFKGTFRDDHYDKGTLTFNDGSYYEGTFKNDTPYNGKYIDNHGRHAGNYVKGKIIWK